MTASRVLALRTAVGRRTVIWRVFAALAVCLSSPAQALAQDLVVTALTNPPAAAAPGGSFMVTDTTQNQGFVTAAASTTRYYLSLDQSFIPPGAFGDFLLTGERSVPTLGPNATSTGTISVTIVSNQAIGLYYVIACADSLSVVSEVSETNNCRVSTTRVQVTRTDLVVDTVTNPPAAAKPGSSFAVTDTVRNQGLVDAGASTTGYFLSTDTIFNAPGGAFGDWRLTGSRAVPALIPGATSMGSVTVTIPPTLSPVLFYLIACADADLAVPENPETNNCRASATRVQITSATSANPFGAVDTPTDNGTGITGAVAFTGWALDDVGVTSVVICRAPVAGETAPVDPNCGGAPQIAVGSPVFIEGARPDVAAAYPAYPQNTAAGWGFMVLTNMLPNQGNGTFVFYVYAGDAEGHVVMLGSRTITCDNANATRPFGAIDTPTQGGVASGTSFFNFGWALTPQPKTIPIDGSTIIVYVDGVPVGNPSYNHFRSDIATLFPGLNNSNGAIGLRVIDTTTLANGLHTIAWSVTDNQGITEGIGSRFFQVSNGPGVADGTGSEQDLDRSARLSVRRALMEDLVAGAPHDRTPIVGRRGWAPDAPWRAHGVGNSDRAVIRSEELDRVELWLGDHPGQRYTAHLRVGGDLSALPIGSHFDKKTGWFTWSPGVGFVGAYDLVFVRWAGAYPVARQEVRIILAPKRGG